MINDKVWMNDKQIVTNLFNTIIFKSELKIY